jgi:VanZ family protein
MTQRQLRWVPALVWTGTILTLTSLPQRQMPAAIAYGGWDKPAHLIVYAILTLLFGYALAQKTPKRMAIAAAALTIAIGTFDEWHQRFIAGRSPDIRDWAQNCAGAALGGVVALLARRIVNRSDFT